MPTIINNETLTLNGSIGEFNNFNSIAMIADTKMQIIDNSYNEAYKITLRNEIFNKNVITSNSNVSENFIVSMSNDDVNVTVTKSDSMLLLTQITESAIVDNNITIYSPTIENEQVLVRIDQLPLYHSGMNEITLRLEYPKFCITF